MKKFKEIRESLNEDAPAMSATGVSGGGPIAGLPPDFPPVAAGIRTGSSMLRRKPPELFGGRAVFKVPSDRYNKALKGRKKFEHYSTYVGRDEIGEEIRAYIRENPDAPIILEDETTGAMVFLKYGKR